MKFIHLTELLELVDNDRELIDLLVGGGVIVQQESGFSAADVDRVLVSRTLVRELEVNAAGVEIILRLREELAIARQTLEDLEPDSDD